MRSIQQERRVTEPFRTSRIPNSKRDERNLFLSQVETAYRHGVRPRVWFECHHSIRTQMLFKYSLKARVLHRLVQHRFGEVRQQGHPDYARLKSLQHIGCIGPRLQVQVALHETFAVCLCQLQSERLAGEDQCFLRHLPEIRILLPKSPQPGVLKLSRSPQGTHLFTVSWKGLRGKSRNRPGVKDGKSIERDCPNLRCPDLGKILIDRKGRRCTGN